MIIFYTIIFIIATAFIGGALLGYLGRIATRRDNIDSPLIAAIDAVLPQLQCAECGYPGCRPYAKAIADDDVPINLCPPGGIQTAKAIAQIINTEIPLMPAAPPQLVAVIRAEDCVGCALCLPACPTDAILGAPQKNHTIITEHCVGCQLCLPPCPADCIDMVEINPRSQV